MTRYAKYVRPDPQGERQLEFYNPRDPIELDGYIIFGATKEQMIAARWSEYIQDDYPQNVELGYTVTTETIEEPGLIHVTYQVVKLPEEQIYSVKQAKLQEANSNLERMCNIAVATYPESEVLTFDQQVKEAALYELNPEISTSEIPLISGIASARGLSLEELVPKINAKHMTYALLSGNLIGQRQAIEDRIEAATTIDEVLAIDTTINIPNLSQLQNQVSGQDSVEEEDSE